jgi:hypothetical protein
MQKSEVILFWASTITLFYFVFLYLNSELFNFEFVFISVIQELITIPMILCAFGILIFGINKIIRKSYGNIRYIMLMILNTLLIFVWIILNFSN